MCELECKNRTPPHCSEKHQLVPVALCLHWNDMHFTFKNTHCSDLVLLLPLGAKIMKPLHINSNFCVCVRLMPSISLQSEFGPRPAAGHSLSRFVCLCLSCSQTKPVPFTIEPENSHQCSGFVCAQFNTQSLYLQCAIDKMPSSEEHPLCVSLL